MKTYGGRRRAVRDARVQPVDSRSAQERHRLGAPALSENAFTRKPSAVIGASPGRLGTAVGQQHLRSVFGFCNSPQMNSLHPFHPRADHGGRRGHRRSTEEFLRRYLGELRDFVVRVLAVLPRTN